MSERGSPGPQRTRARPLPWAVLLLCALPAVLSAQVPAPAASSGLPLHVGAYGGAVLNTPALDDWGAARVSETSASVLVSGTPWRRLAYFAELDAVSRSDENYAHLETERSLDLARLYAEYAFSDALRVRVGRFLTPIGEWNEVHAEPLTWTSIRPLTTYRSFAKSVTGVLLGGEAPLGGHESGWALYAARSGFGHEEHEVRFDDVVGARGALELRDGWWLGASGAVLRERRPLVDDDDLTETPDQERDEDQNGDGDVLDRSPRGLLGLDARASVHGVELTSEATWLSPLAAEHAEWGAFGQVAVPLVGPWFAVGRIERFTPRSGPASTTGTLGTVLRPRSWITLKAERQLAPTDVPRLAHGWFLSASVLF
jgi:hypothetical protein